MVAAAAFRLSHNRAGQAHSTSSGEGRPQAVHGQPRSERGVLVDEGFATAGALALSAAEPVSDDEPYLTVTDPARGRATSVPRLSG